MTPGDAAGAEIGLGLRAGDRAAGTEQAARGLGELLGAGGACAALLAPRQGEKTARLVHGLAQAGEIAIEADQVEEIAVFLGRGVGPFAGGTRDRNRDR